MLWLGVLTWGLAGLEAFGTPQTIGTLTYPFDMTLSIVYWQNAMQGDNAEKRGTANSQMLQASTSSDIVAVIGSSEADVPTAGNHVVRLSQLYLRSRLHMGLTTDL